jgi:hypothetical protein
MANYNSSNVIVEFDVSDGGSLQVMTPYVREISVADVNLILQESHSFGDSWVEFLSTGIKKMEKITLKGFYDDTASTGPNVVFNSQTGVSRTLKITWGSTKTTSVETLIESYKRIPSLNSNTMYEVVLQPTGTVTEA